MDRKAYELANELHAEEWLDGEEERKALDEMEIRRYQKAVLGKIRKEKKMARRRFGKVSVAACAAVVLLGSAVVFGGEVHAAIRQISWSIGSALGLSSDLENYRDVVNTSVADKGYVITLQEVVATEEKLVVNYTLQREDGQPMEEILIPTEELYVNGHAIRTGAGGGGSFLDETQTIVGVEMGYELPDLDLSESCDFRLEFNSIGFEKPVRGTWKFAFTADGAELIADTKHVALQREFTLPDGAVVTLEELSLNELEQRISYVTSVRTDYILQVIAEDENGQKVEFDTTYYDGKKGSGYMRNQEIIDDGRIASDANQVMMGLYVVELPKESGQMSHDYVQVGESFEVTLSF